MTDPFDTRRPERQSAPPTIAEHLVHRLVAAGARHVFGVPGDYNLRFLDVIEAHPELEWVGNANELDAAYAADGYARIRGFAVLVTTYGVGELSAMNGLAGSFAESVPVLHIVGSPATPVQRDGLPVHHSLLDGDPGHFTRALDEVTCASSVLTAANAADEIDRVLASVFTEKRPGSISLPADLVHHPIGPFEPEPAFAHQPVDEQQLAAFRERAAALFDGVPRDGAPRGSVALLADHLAQRQLVRAELDAVARIPGVGSAVTAPGKGVLDETAPGFLGLYIGALSEEPVRAAVEGADVVIGAGLRLADLSSGGFTARLDPAKLIDLRDRHAVLAGESFPVGMAAALGVLRELLTERAPLPAAASRPEPAQVSAPVSEPLAGPLTQLSFWARMARFVQSGDIIAADQGTPFYGVATLPLPSGVDVVAQPLWASIGYALPAVLGAQLASEGRRRAILLIGDGSAQMTIQELGTLIRHGLDPVIFLLNNDGYTVERAINGPTARYNDIAAWNWSLVPAAMGAAADTVVRRVVTGADLDQALSDCADNAGKLTFIEVVLDRMDLPALLARTADAVANQNR
ncbi:MAG: indolepyruvate decarboxylase [Pseudonocardiales bacterium]|nr:indolepyruvate decarboxylase [Pseudonocardiales bacterium]